MPDITTNLRLKKPIGTETVTRTAYNENLDILDNNAAKKDSVTALQQEVTTHKADYTLQVPYAGTTTGSANTYAIATPVITALTAGMAISVKFNVDSTGASTLNWYGFGAKGIKKANGADVTNLKATGIYTLRYDGTNFILQGEGASGNATASDLLSGKTASTDAGDITGTMIDRGTIYITPNTINQTIPDGKHSGSGVVFGNPNLLSANIKNSVNIFGIVGTAPIPSGNATAAQVLTGYTFSNASAVGIAGSLKDISGLTLFANSELVASTGNPVVTIYSGKGDPPPPNYRVVLSRVPKLLIIFVTLYEWQQGNYPRGIIPGMLSNLLGFNTFTGRGGYSGNGQASFILQTRADNLAFGVQATYSGSGSMGVDPEDNQNYLRYYAYD